MLLSHDVPKSETEPFKPVKATETFTEETSLALTSLNYSVKFFGQPRGISQKMVWQRILC